MIFVGRCAQGCATILESIGDVDGKLKKHHSIYHNLKIIFFFIGFSLSVRYRKFEGRKKSLMNHKTICLGAIFRKWKKTVSYLTTRQKQEESQ